MMNNSLSNPSLEDTFTLNKPQPVTEIRVFRNHEQFPVCPRCQLTMEREYQAFCDRCGQALDWSRFPKVLIVFR